MKWDFAKWNFDDIISLGLFGAALGAIGYIVITLALYAFGVVLTSPTATDLAP